MDKLDIQLQHSIRGEFALGWNLVQELERERPTCNRCAFNRGWYVLRQGKLSEGMELISRGRWEKVFGSPPLKTNKSIFNIRVNKNDIKDKFILLNLEGGLGDEMIGVRFAKEINNLGGKCIIACHPTLMNLFSNNKYICALVTSQAASNTFHDYWIPSMNAETCFNNTYETLPSDPYLEAKPSFIQKYYKIMGKDSTDGIFRIGIRWIGLPDFEHEQYRRFPDYLLFDLVNKYKNNKNIEFYSLQRDLADKSNLLEHVIDMEPYLTSWDDTSGIVANLDLVISSCTSVAHLSAAMDIPTWVIVPILSYYIWANERDKDEFGGEYTWYYKSARLFRQEKFGDWTKAFEKLEIALDKFVKNETKKENQWKYLI